MRRTREGAPSSSAASAFVAALVLDPDFAVSDFFAVDFLERAGSAFGFDFVLADEPSSSEASSAAAGFFEPPRPRPPRLRRRVAVEAGALSVVSASSFGAARTVFNWGSRRASARGRQICLRLATIRANFSYSSSFTAYE